MTPARSLATLLVTSLFAAPAAAAQDDPAPPWRLADAVGAPTWFHIHGKVETRYESLDERLRANETGSNQGIFTRVLLEMRLSDTFVDANVELMDSRIFDEPDDARTTTGQVNTAELLQGYAAARFTDAFEPGDRLRIQAGRHTMNVGSRRLAARNVYRNTINAFTGVNAQWESTSGAWARAFYTLPVQRLPGNGDLAALRDNETRFDEERTQVRFWGVIAGRPDVAFGSDLEVYFFGLDEKDGDDLATRDRDLSTVGARYYRSPERGAAHWELESVVQFGESRASAGSTTDLDHEAYLHHVTLGVTLDHSTRPRIEALFDIASGDRDPTDGANERFDTLYGVPRPEFGPTGIFREVARANLVSPGLRLDMRPAPRWQLMLMQRFNYLASDRDAWTTTGIQDAGGGSGSHIGNLSEARIRYDVVPNSVRLELGVAYHAAGSFAKNAPNSNGGPDALFGYFQTNFTF